MALFPNVPNVPGVPPLPRNPLAALPGLIVMTRDIIRLLTGFGAAPWGLFKDGQPVIVADSVISFDYKQDWALATAPQENGAFMTYDKVQTPFGLKIRFASGGDETNRQALIDSVEVAANSLDRFDAMTPEKIYESVNIAHVDYRRTAIHGVGLLVADVWCLQVRVPSSGIFTNTIAPSGAAPVNGGNVQTTTPTEAQATDYGTF